MSLNNLRIRGMCLAFTECQIHFLTHIQPIPGANVASLLHPRTELDTRASVDHIETIDNEARVYPKGSASSIWPSQPYAGPADSLNTRLQVHTNSPAPRTILMKPRRSTSMDGLVELRWRAKIVFGLRGYESWDREQLAHSHPALHAREIHVTLHTDARKNAAVNSDFVTVGMELLLSGQLLTDFNASIT
ncbi:hypothetical protein DXG01_016848 [Tephrocybe rancida]|nr:hypothetical protein DXG01_016848 [Tephrocybe rancida]